MKNIEDVLHEREKTHGSFKEHALVSQSLKRVVRDNWQSQSASLEANESLSEALGMILHKIGRIVAGDETEVDHWQDIAGYATLAVKELEREQ